MKYHPLAPAGAQQTIGICQRCHFKFHLSVLRSDPDTPGLRVCPDCADERDPYKLPARKAEKITVRHPRPDVPLTIPEDE